LFIPGSYDEDKEKALESIRFWRGSMIKFFYEVDFHDPRRIEENAQIIGDDTLENMALVTSDTEEGIKSFKSMFNLDLQRLW
jgi:coenzyme F420-dependent glucose-6-phosphate dehydrogenase